MKLLKNTFLLLAFALMLAGCKETSSENPVEESSQASKTDKKEPIVLTYGYIDEYNFEDLDSSIQEQIVSFNRSQSEYFIEVVKYGNDSYADGLKALNADISAGKAPDIIEVRDEELLHQLGKKGVIEDLYPYIDDGEGPQREDFLDNILPCFEQDGKLYGLTPLFKIQSIIGNPNYITSEQITFEQLKGMVEDYNGSEEIKVCNDLTRNFILGYCILPSLDEFVDMGNYRCDFQNERFQELLEFSVQFEDGWGNDDTVSVYAGLQQNKLCLYYAGVIGNFQGYTRCRELTGETGFSLLGFPSINGCTPQITTNFPYLAINSNSEYKDVAWQFLCTFLEDEYLSDNDVISAAKGFPITKSGFERMAQKAMLANASGGENSSTNTRGETITYPSYSTSQEEVAYITEIVKNSERLSDYGEIENIIWEEIEHYWNGTKTVQEVMEVIQNRAQLYLSEME